MLTVDAMIRQHVPIVLPERFQEQLALVPLFVHIKAAQQQLGVPPEK